jgi:Polysaccharide lyase
MKPSQRNSVLIIALALAAVGLVLSMIVTGARTTHVKTGASFVDHRESRSSRNLQRGTGFAAVPQRPTGPGRRGPRAGKTTLKPQWVGRFSKWRNERVWPYANFCINSSPGCTNGIAGPHVFPVKDPLGSGRTVLQFTVNDRDVPYEGSTGARGDVESPRLFRDGADLYVSLPYMFPNSFPRITSAWFEVAEIYGPPTGCSPPVGVYLYHRSSGDHLAVGRGGYGAISLFPRLTRHRWHAVILHVKMSTDPAVGFVQAWYDGVQQTFTGGVSTDRYATLRPGCNWDGTHANFLDIDSYREYGGYPGNVTLYHGAPAVGTSYASVAGTLANPPYGP